MSKVLTKDQEIKRLVAKVSKLELYCDKLQTERDRAKEEAQLARQSIDLVEKIIPEELEPMVKDKKLEEAHPEVYNKEQGYFRSLGMSGSGTASHLWNARIREQVAALTCRPIAELDVKGTYSFVISCRGALRCPDCKEQTVLVLRQVQFGGASNNKHSTHWHPNTWYITCSCGDNPGEHYLTPFEALDGWNAYVLHLLKVNDKKARREAFEKRLDALCLATEAKQRKAGKNI